MMVPTTIAVAFTIPMDRLRSAAVLWMLASHRLLVAHMVQRHGAIGQAPIVCWSLTWCSVTGPSVKRKAPKCGPLLPIPIAIPIPIGIDDDDDGDGDGDGELQL
jgi:hypothetical protein